MEVKGWDVPPVFGWVTKVSQEGSAFSLDDTVAHGTAS